jgi:hypothetical protein
MIAAFVLTSGSCIVPFLCSSVFISGLQYYTSGKVFGSLTAFFIYQLCIEFIIVIVLWDIAHAVFVQLLACKEPSVMQLRLNDSLKLAESIVILQTMLLRPGTICHPVLQYILHSMFVVDSAIEDPFPMAQIVMAK